MDLGERLGAERMIKSEQKLEQEIFEESHNLDFQFVPWSNDKVRRVVIEQVNKALAKRDEIDADFLQAERDASYVLGLKRAKQIVLDNRDWQTILQAEIDQAEGLEK